jgi:hypothetical protein
LVICNVLIPGVTVVDAWMLNSARFTGKELSAFVVGGAGAASTFVFGVATRYAATSATAAKIARNTAPKLSAAAGLGSCPEALCATANPLDHECRLCDLMPS